MRINTKGSSLVVFEFNAGDPDLLQRWAQEGYLPRIASIMKRGCWGRTSEQICEQGSGLSLFSGISASQHGYYWFRQLKPGTYDLGIFTPRDVDAPPFWSYLCESNKKVAIIDAFETDPVGGLPGIQLANWATHQPTVAALPASAEPAWLLQEVRRVFGPQMPIAEFKLNSSLREDSQVYRRLLERVEKKGALCRHLLSGDHFDLVVIGFFEAHTGAHRFWNYRPEAYLGGTASQENELTHAIRDVYQAIDRQIGLLLEQMPDEANVFILSLFGMKDEYPTTGLIESFCHQLGYQVSPEASSFSLKPMDLVRRLVPEAWRVAVSHHLPRSMQERLLSELFRSGTNWHKTTAFSIPSLYTSFVRVNLRGREPQGIIEPGAEYETLLDRLESDLRQLVDPQTGEPAVIQVLRAGKLFDCGPDSMLPDLFVEWKPGGFMPRIVHPHAELGQQKQNYFRGNSHSMKGFIAAAGPSILARGAIDDVPSLDLAPTFLSLMGEPIPERMARQREGATIRG